MKKLILLIVIFLQTSCTGLPKDIVPIHNFDVTKYLGTWYEIARLDHSFERNLTQVTAEYSVRENGGINIINKGYNAKNKQWKEAKGKAYFIDDNTIAHLKVSFFGPFYGSYVIFKIDTKNYQYAYITSYNKNFLWLLSRTPKVSDAIKNDFLKTAQQYGFNTDELIFVKQELPNP